MDVLRLLSDARLVRSVDGNTVPADASLAIVHGRDADTDAKADTSGMNDHAYVGLYFAFGEHNFTPKLKTFYERFNACVDPGRRLEIILVNSEDYDDDGDDDHDFDRHLQDMPWLAVSNTDQKSIRNLKRVLRVNIAKSDALLVIVDAKTGQVVSRNGASRFADDPDGAGFPWVPPSLESLLGERLVDSAGALHDPTTVKIDLKLLYFSANWCPPCKAFTPQLAKTCDHLSNDREITLQVIFVSFDRSRESFEQYFSTMPATWFAVPYADETRRKELAGLLLVQGIPSLVVLDENNKVLTRDARHEITEDPEGKNFPWKPRLVEVLTAKLSSRLHENPFLVLFTDGNADELEQAKAILWPIAEELAVKEEDTLRLCFFVAGEDEVCDSLRNFAELEDVVPLLVIVDTVIEEKYVLDDDVELSVDVVRRFVRSFLDGKLQATPLSFRKPVRL